MKNTLKKGFTLIEVIVSVSIFVVVMMIAVGAVLNAVEANRKAQSMNVVINNVNLAFESMIRDLRTGKGYGNCGSDCVSFEDKNGNDVQYSVNESDGLRYIEKSGESGVLGTGAITSEEVSFDDGGVSFIVQSGDGMPERILLRIKGSAGIGKTKSEFNVQTLITSRFLTVPTN